MERTVLVSKEFHLGPRFSDPQASALVIYTVLLAEPLVTSGPLNVGKPSKTKGPHGSQVSGAFPPPVPWLSVKGQVCHSLSSRALLSTQGILGWSGHLWAMWSTMASLACKG